jgi:hypothetical protein
MALVTSLSETIPDLNYEYHTVTIDTIGQVSSNAFSVFLNQPLKNVVQARLLAARIHTNDSTEHCYISIDELNTNFNERTSNVYEGQGDISTVRRSFATLITDQTTRSGSDSLIVFKDNYPVVSQYIDPIRKIDRLTMKIMNQQGETIKNSTVSGSNFLVLHFVCRKPNL